MEAVIVIGNWGVWRKDFMGIVRGNLKKGGS
jgi:hypothetical protein